jgi:hypothetical protein
MVIRAENFLCCEGPRSLSLNIRVRELASVAGVNQLETSVRAIPFFLAVAGYHR